MKVGDRVRYSGEGVITATHDHLPGMAMVDGIWCDVTKMEIIPSWADRGLYIDDQGLVARWYGTGRYQWYIPGSDRWYERESFTPVKRLIEEDL